MNLSHHPHDKMLLPFRGSLPFKISQSQSLPGHWTGIQHYCHLCLYIPACVNWFADDLLWCIILKTLVYLQCGMYTASGEVMQTYIAPLPIQHH